MSGVRPCAPSHTCLQAPGEVEPGSLGGRDLLASCSEALQDSAPTPAVAGPTLCALSHGRWLHVLIGIGDLVSPGQRQARRAICCPLCELSFLVWEGSLQSGLVLGLRLLQTWDPVALFDIPGFLKKPLLEESAEKMGLKWETLSQGDPTAPSEKGRAVGMSGRELPGFQTPALRPLPRDSVTGGTSFSMSEAFLPGPRGDLARRGCSGCWDSFLSFFPVRGLLATSQDLAVMCFRRAQSETPAPAPNAPG